MTGITFIYPLRTLKRMSTRYYSNRLINRKIKKQHWNRAVRPKTFKSETAAKIYAEKMGIKDYVLRNLKFEGNKEKKIRIKIKE